MTDIFVYFTKYCEYLEYKTKDLYRYGPISLDLSIFSATLYLKGGYMKKQNKIITIASIILLPISIYSQNNFDIETAINGNCGIIRNVSIYGKDDREEYCNQNMIIRELADSVAALFNDDGKSIVKVGNNYKFGTTTLAQSENLSPSERFAEQPAVAFCSGFLVGEDLLATAGHCVKDKPSDSSDHENAGCDQNKQLGVFCENIKIVFGYRKELGGIIPKQVSEENVYKCVKVIAHSLKSGSDYTIIKLDRKVKDRKPLAINRKNSGLKKGTEIFVMGHPSGLPLKIAGNAEVIKINETMQVTFPNGGQSNYLNKDYSFLTNLDTFHGNSGSPVINAKTLLVEGILVSGDIDYISDSTNPATNVAATYPQNPNTSEYGKGVGEVATKISVTAKYIPSNKSEKEMFEMNKKAKGNLYKVLLDTLLKYQEQYRRSNGIIPIPNFTPDGNGGGTQVVPAIYYPPSIPEPKPEVYEI